MSAVQEDEKVFASIPEAVEEIRNGRMVIVVDDAAGVLEATFDATIRTCRPATDSAVGAAANVTRTICCAPDVVSTGVIVTPAGSVVASAAIRTVPEKFTRSSTRSIPPAAPCWKS